MQVVIFLEWRPHCCTCWWWPSVRAYFYTCLYFWLWCRSKVWSGWCPCTTTIWTASWLMKWASAKPSKPSPWSPTWWSTRGSTAPSSSLFLSRQYSSAASITAPHVLIWQPEQHFTQGPVIKVSSAYSRLCTQSKTSVWSCSVSERKLDRKSFLSRLHLTGRQQETTSLRWSRERFLPDALKNAASGSAPLGAVQPL